MPAVNPFIDPGFNVEAIDGSPVLYGPSAYTIRQQDPRPGAIASPSMNVGAPTTSQTNASGTSENVAMHVAVIVVLALLGVYALNKSGFRFVVAGGIG